MTKLLNRIILNGRNFTLFKRSIEQKAKKNSHSVDGFGAYTHYIVGRYGAESWLRAFVYKTTIELHVMRYTVCVEKQYVTKGAYVKDE